HLSLSNTLAINATNQFPLQTDSPGSEYDKETSLFIYLFHSYRWGNGGTETVILTSQRLEDSVSNQASRDDVEDMSRASGEAEDGELKKVVRIRKPNVRVGGPEWTRELQALITVTPTVQNKCLCLARVNTSYFVLQTMVMWGSAKRMEFDR
ncbi:hypothetical protein ACJX0J_036594, partial [Zea mays]